MSKENEQDQGEFWIMMIGITITFFVAINQVLLTSFIAFGIAFGVSYVLRPPLK